MIEFKIMFNVLLNYKIWKKAIHSLYWPYTVLSKCDYKHFEFGVRLYAILVWSIWVLKVAFLVEPNKAIRMKTAKLENQSVAKSLWAWGAKFNLKLLLGNFFFITNFYHCMQFSNSVKVYFIWNKSRPYEKFLADFCTSLLWKKNLVAYQQSTYDKWKFKPVVITWPFALTYSIEGWFFDLSE